MAAARGGGTFLWLTPAIWLLTVPLAVLVTGDGRLGPVEVAIGIAACQAARLLACTSPLRPGESCPLPPVKQLATLLLTGTGCGAAYAWLLTSGTIDAWDEDVLRQTIYQTGFEQWVWGFIGGVAAVVVAAVASAFAAVSPPGRNVWSGWWPLTVALAAALLLAWAIRLLFAVSIDGMAREGGFNAGLLTWAIATPVAAAGWVLLTRRAAVRSA